jgi:hypothetical protein
MEKTEKVGVIDREFAPQDAQKQAEQDYEKIVSFLLSRYLKERDKDKK